MKIQMEQLDLLAPWPPFTLRDGYYAIRVLVRIGTLPIGDVYLRPVRKRVVTNDRLRRRIARRYADAITQALPSTTPRKIDAILDPAGVPADLREAFLQLHEQPV